MLPHLVDSGGVHCPHSCPVIHPLCSPVSSNIKKVPGGEEGGGGIPFKVGGACAEKRGDDTKSDAFICGGGLGGMWDRGSVGGVGLLGHDQAKRLEREKLSRWRKRAHKC